jgi:hypothetical protein
MSNLKLINYFESKKKLKWLIYDAFYLTYSKKTNPESKTKHYYSHSLASYNFILFAIYVYI